MTHKYRLCEVFVSCVVLYSVSAFAQAPTIDAISPSDGVVGAHVQIAGSGFGEAQGSSTIALNGTSATVTGWSDGAIDAIVPTGASSGAFAVTVNGQASYSSSFTVLTEPSGWTDADIGSVGKPGSATFANGVFTVSGAGSGVTSWAAADSFHFAYQPLSGDGTIVARVISEPVGAYVGLMIRQSTDAGSINASLTEYQNSSSAAEYFYDRTTTGGNQAYVTSIGSLPLPPYWLKMVRAGNSISSYRSPDGVNWTQLGSTQTVSMTTSVEVGLVVTSGSTSSLATATIDSVSITSSGTPAPAISSISPTTGNVNSQAVITGTGFGGSQGASVVTLNGAPVTVNSWSDTSITITIPTSATTGSLLVSVAPSMNDSNLVMFEVTSQPLPSGWLDQDVGLVGKAGSATFANGVFTVNGAGTGINSGAADSFHFVYQPLSGDGTILARVVSEPVGAYVGLMIRQTTDPGSVNANLTEYQNSSSAAEYFYDRTTAGGNETIVTGIGSLPLPPYWVKMVRAGNSISSYRSPDGVNWTQLGTTQTVSMTTSVEVGLVVTSGSTSSLATATIDSVSVNWNTEPAPLIIQVSATTGSPGSQVVITGTGFGSSQGDSEVTLNGAPVTVNSWSDLSITITIPTSATTGSLLVSVAPSMNDSNPVMFEVSSQPLPSGWLDQDVGLVGKAGSATFANGVFTVSGAGTGINSGTADSFHFVYQPLSGDGTILARVVSEPVGAYVGLMIRQTTDPASVNGSLTEYLASASSAAVYFYERTTAGGNESYVSGVSVPVPPYWLKMVRAGNSITTYRSSDGASWTQLGTTQTISMTANVDVGLLVTSSNTSSLATATFDNVNATFNGQIPEPLIANILPNTAVPGASVTISGTNFGSSQGSSTVTFNGTAGSPTTWTTSGIAVPVPMGATSGNIVVTVSGVASNGVPFTVSTTPTINAMSPTSGPAGTTVAITGVNFGSPQGNSTISFNGTAAAPTSWTATGITVPVPSAATSGNVVVTVNGTSSSGTPFTVLQVPSISNLSSAAGPIGSSLTITGSNFGSTQGTSTVTLNGAALSATSWSATSIAITVPANATSGSIIVTVSGLASNAIPFTVFPSIAGVSPSSGLVGASATISGSNFGTSQGNSSITFGGVSATATSWSATSIIAPVPIGASTGSVIVTVGGNASNAVAFTVTPTITSVTPASGPIGTSVTITGQFGATQGSGTIAFNGTLATPTSWSSTSIVVPVPTGATTGNIVLTVGGVNTAGTPFTVLSDPSISSLSPISGPAGTTVTISGANFGGSQGNSTVTFSGTVTAPLSWSGSTITVAVPAGATSGNVIVTVNGLASTGAPFTVLPSPAINSLSPTSGISGTTITITGTNFGTTQGTNTLTFNGTPASPTIWTTTSIVAPIPSSATTGAVVVTVNGVPSNSMPLTVFGASLPPVAQIQPANGSSSVPLNGRIVVRFAQPVQQPSIVSGTITVQQGTTNVAGSTALSADGLSVTFVPSQNWSASTSYSVAVTDVADNQSSPLFQSSFTSGTTTDTTAPQLIQTNPQNGNGGVPLSTPIVFQFSKPMDPATFTPQNVFVADGTSGARLQGLIQVDPSGMTASFIPNPILGVGRSFTAEAGNLVLDSSGNSFSPTYFSFSTGFSPDLTNPMVMGTSPSNGASAVPTNALVVVEFNKPIDLATVSSGFQVQTAGNPVPGAIALSDGNRRITFTPLGGLAATSTYTIVTTPQLADVGGLPLSNPGSSQFITGSAPDTTAPTISSVSPTIGSTAVPTNSVIQIQFSKPIDPFTVTPLSLYAELQAGAVPIASTVTVSADGRTATLSPTAALQDATAYDVVATSAITDPEGNALYDPPQIAFTTSVMGIDTSAPTVTSVSPANGATGVPVNPQIDVVMSAPVAVPSVGSNAMAVSAGGTPIAGTITLSSDQTTLTWVPTGLLVANTAYTVSVSGLTDNAGNAMVPFTTAFTTGSSGTANTTGPSVVSVSPSNGATTVSVNSTIVLTFSEAIDLTTVNNSTIPISISGFSGVLAGTYSLDSTSTLLTFVPLSPLPANATVTINAGTGVVDLSGNRNANFSSAFTTGSGTDSMAPTVVSVTPQNDSTGIGQNAVVVLTFSKSLNRSTITTNNFGLLVNGVSPAGGVAISASSDNRVVTLNPFGLAASSTVTVLVTSAVTDLWGNPVVPFESQFTTAPAPSTSRPQIGAQRPANGAAGVAQNASIVIYFSQPMNAASVTGAVHVSQNGTLVSGTLQATDNGQVVQFTPSVPWQNSAYIQVFVDSTAQSALGVNLGSYQGSFTVAANMSSTAASATGTNPQGGLPVPTNVVMDIAFNVPLDPTTLTPTSVLCYQNGSWLQTDVSLANGGSLLQIIPRFPLQPNTVTSCSVSTTVQGVNGVPSQGASLTFTTGSGPDTAVPAILSISPPNGSINIGDNAGIRLTFSKPINPLTVNPTTVQLSVTGGTMVPTSISFSNNNQSVLLVPQTPLPDSAQITLTISGVTDVAGNPVASQSTEFTTMAGPDFTPPVIVLTSPEQFVSSPAPTVPLNAIIQVEASKPIDSGTVNSNTMPIMDSGNNLVAGSYSLSADARTITFVPSGQFTPGQTYSVSPVSGGIADLSGNILGGPPSPLLGNFQFVAGTSASTSAPQVSGFSPVNGAITVPVNVQPTVLFNEPIDLATLGQLSLNGPGGPVAISTIITSGNQLVRLIPVVALAPGTQYTVSVAGVQDMSGNVLASPITSAFTTGNSPDFTQGRIVSSNPSANATGVSTSTVVQVQFSKPINPLTVTPTTFQVLGSLSTLPASGTNTVSPDGLTVTFTPSEPLASSTQYVIQFSNSITDLEGQSLYQTSPSFTTGQNATPPVPVIESLSPYTSGAPGSGIQIKGLYFGTSQGTSTVTFNGQAASPTSWSDSWISLVVPSGATSGPLVVTVGGVASNSIPFTVYYQPTVTNISPTSGPAGTVVTITGTNFGDAYDQTQVTFPSAPVISPSGSSETSVTVTVPPGAVTGGIVVSVDGYQATSPVFTVIPTPSITSLSANAGVPGTQVTIYGNSFGSTQGSSAVYFNGVAASVTSWNNTYINAVAPSNVTSGPVTVMENSITSNSNYVFTVTTPAIGSLSPPAGATGATVVITGSGLTASGLTTEVSFNGLPGSVATSSLNSLTVYVPNNATTGPVAVSVGGTVSNSLNFTVEQPPTITDVSPNTGPFVNGVLTPITITGSGFGATQSNTTVNFWSSQTAPSIVSWSDTAITLSVPPDVSTGPITVTVGEKTATSPSWFTANRQTLVTDSLGNQTTYSFQYQGGQWFTTASAGPGCVTCTIRGNNTYTGDSNGNILTSTDDLSNTSTYTYDTNNNMASASRPLNANATATTSYTYNSFGEVLTMTDPLGNTTTNTYDPNGNLLSVTTPQPNGNTAASVTQFQYDTKGELTQITDPLNHATTLSYYPTGLIASITDAQNNVTLYQYDSRGNRTAVIDPVNGAAHPTIFTYDIMNRLTGITYPDNSSVGFGYDVRGRRISSTDQNNRTTIYSYDDADRLTAVTDPANHTTQYGYDTEDNLLSITDANGHTTQFAYNARGWVTQTTFPSTLQESYTYDAVGNLLSKTDRKNQTIQYVYDALYRLTSKTYPDSTGVEYAYDLAGKVQQVSDPTGTYGFAYDNMGRLIGTATQYSYLPGLNFQNGYGYDAASNRISLTAPDGSTTAYGYDSLNRLNALANSWAGSFGFGYDALSRRTSLTRPNGVNTNYTYDSLSHLSSVLHQAGSTVLDGAGYTYDPAGNRSSKTNYLNGITSGYTYDLAYQLTQVTQGSSTTESYTYDPVGNRLSSLGVPTYSYNSSNELSSSSLGSYSYDANGNTLSDASGRSFTWDFENRLTQVVNPGVGTTTFRYDPFGRRVQKSGPLGTTSYLYDGSSIIDELDNSGNVLARYAATADIDQPLSVLRGSIGSYYQQDGLGSVTSLSNGSGAVANTYGFDSYGKLNASTGVLINPFQYTGRESDQEIGLYYYRARYYDPSIGRFISEDPIAMVGGLNSYTYGDNRPSSLYDPSGLSGVEPAATQVDAVAAGLQRILDLLPGDPNCMRFLCHGAGSSPTENPIQELTEILQFRAFGVAPIPPTTDSSGNPISITNALSNGYVVGQAITVNTQGAFFSGTWTVDRGKIPGNTPAAQGFILLHELSHLMNSIQPDFNNQAIVDQNDKNIEKNCKKLIKALGRRQ